MLFPIKYLNFIIPIIINFLYLSFMCCNILIWIYYKKYGNLTSKQLSDISHDFIGWKNTKDGEIIDTDYAKELNV